MENEAPRILRRLIIIYKICGPLAQKACIRQTTVVSRTTIKEMHCKTLKKKQEIRPTKKGLIIEHILCPYLT
jgi:hypothetical protein